MEQAPRSVHQPARTNVSVELSARACIGIFDLRGVGELQRQSRHVAAHPWFLTEFVDHHHVLVRLTQGNDSFRSQSAPVQPTSTHAPTAAAPRMDLLSKRGTISHITAR